jgi:TonB family protein
LAQHDHSPIPVTGAYAPRRHFASLAGSIAAHLAVFALIFYLAPRLPEHHDWVLAYVVEMGGGHGADPGGGKPGAEIPATLLTMPGDSLSHEFSEPPPEPKALPITADDALTPMPRPGVMAALSVGALRPYRGPGGSSAAGGRVSSSASGHSHGHGAGAGIGSDAGDGVGDGSGDGLEGAHADYAANPFPIYPARSRRLAEEGTVTLRVMVAADGSVKQIKIAESSGFDDLDESALKTVRTRWRFVPAHRGDGRPVASWVLVPIRFALR